MLIFSAFLWSFWRGILLAMPIGPVALLCLQTVVAEGFWAGFIFGLGVATADAFFSAVAVCSLGVVAAIMAKACVPIKIIGGAFLLYIGYRVTQFHIKFESKNEADIPSQPVRIFLSALLVTVLNPLNLLLFIGLFSGWGCVPDVTTGLVLVLGVISGSLLWWTSLSMLITLIKHRLPDSFLRVINTVSGIALMGFGAFLILYTLSCFSL